MIYKIDEEKKAITFYCDNPKITDLTEQLAKLELIYRDIRVHWVVQLEKPIVEVPVEETGPPEKPFFPDFNYAQNDLPEDNPV